MASTAGTKFGFTSGDYQDSSVMPPNMDEEKPVTIVENVVKGVVVGDSSVETTQPETATTETNPLPIEVSADTNLTSTTAANPNQSEAKRYWRQWGVRLIPSGDCGSTNCEACTAKRNKESTTETNTETTPKQDTETKTIPNPVVSKTVDESDTTKPEEPKTPNPATTPEEPKTPGYVNAGLDKLEAAMAEHAEEEILKALINRVNIRSSKCNCRRCIVNRDKLSEDLFSSTNLTDYMHITDPSTDQQQNPVTPEFPQFTVRDEEVVVITLPLCRSSMKMCRAQSTKEASSEFNALVKSGIKIMDEHEDPCDWMDPYIDSDLINDLIKMRIDSDKPPRPIASVSVTKDT